MVDSAIAILLGVLLVEMARFGGYVSVHPPENPEIARRYSWRFRAYALVACLLIVVQGVRTYLTSRAAQAVQAQLNRSIDGLHQDIQKSDTGRQVDDAYLKAKLEDAYRLNDQFAGLAPALMKMAEASENYTKKEYESKALSDAKLLALTKNVVTEIRGLGKKCRDNEDAIFEPPQNQVPRSQLQSMSRDQLIQLGRERSQETQREYIQNRQNCEQSYRQNIQGEASYARRELMSRVGGDEFLLPRERTKYLAIDGIFAGPDPIDDSADYLEALANKLTQEAPKPPK